MEQKEFVEEAWNIKKISIAVVIIIAVIAGGYIFYQHNKLSQGSIAPVRRPESLSIPSSSNIEIQVKEQVNSLKKQAGNLTVAEVASSSPQVQKILNDIKSLQDYPKNQAKEMCQQICNKF